MQSSSRGACFLCVVLVAIVISITTIPVAGQGKGKPTPASTDGPCWALGHRYVNCGNGTVTDQVTGLIWLQQSDCLGGSDWAQANQVVQALKHGDCFLADNSIAGQWRLATRAEWEATLLMPPAPCTFPALTNDTGSACWGAGPSSLLNVVADAYWTSTARYSVELPNPLDRMRFAWKANLGVAGMEPTLATDIYRIWPVR
jgi:hypothetical protein